MRFIKFEHQRPLLFGFAVVLVLSLCLSLAPNQVEANTDSNLANSVIQYAHSPDNLFPNPYHIDHNDIFIENLERIEPERVQTFTLNMPQLLDREKHITVLLPSSYQTSSVNYPVLYLQDAQQVFYHLPDAGDAWYVKQPMLDFYTSALPGEAIIVAIERDSIYFWDEYSPWVNDDMYLWMDPYDANRIQGGLGDAYLEFVVQTLKTEIDQRYRTLPSRENTAAAGYDMGGLFSLYAGLARPDIFSTVAALSPAVWFAENDGAWLSNNRLIDLINSTEFSEDISFVINVGDQEKTTEIDVRPAVYDAVVEKITFPQAYLQGARAVAEALLDNGIALEDINRGDLTLDDWWEASVQPVRADSKQFNATYLPFFFKQGLDSFTMMDTIQDRKRKVWVYLPPEYFLNDKSYQVIYLLDAQHTFGSETGAIIADNNDWLFDEKLDELYAETGKGTIAVAIEFDATHPWDDYMPWDNNNMDNWLNNTPDAVHGNGKKLLQFYVEELKPRIDTQYRTKPERQFTAIGGGSRSALFSLYAALTESDTYSKALLMSPAIWLAEGGVRTKGTVFYPPWLTYNQMRAYIKQHGVPENVKFYLYIGGAEVSGPPEPYPYVKYQGQKISMPKAYYDGAFMVRTEMLNLGADLKWNYNADGTHLAQIWRYVLPRALDWLGLY